MQAQRPIQQKILMEIETLSDSDLESVLGIIENYKHSNADETEWNQIPESWKKRIVESLLQADAGNLILLEDAVLYIRKKYGLNE